MTDSVVVEGVDPSVYARMEDLLYAKNAAAGVRSALADTLLAGPPPDDARGTRERSAGLHVDLTSPAVAKTPATAGTRGGRG